MTVSCENIQFMVDYGKFKQTVKKKFPELNRHFRFRKKYKFDFVDFPQNLGSKKTKIRQNCESKKNQNSFSTHFEKFCGSDNELETSSMG